MNQDRQLTQDCGDEGERVDMARLARYWNGVRRRKWPILAFTAAASLVAALYSLSITPIFLASTTILIESQPANVISIEEVYELDSRSQQYFATQVEILGSRPLAEMVIETLNLVDEPEFAASENNPGSRQIWRSWLLLDLAGPSTSNSLGPLPGAIKAYDARLSVEPIRDTQLVRVYFESAQPELAARVANAHAQAYIRRMLTERVDVTESAGAWMAQRLGGMEAALRESERKLQAFRERKQIVDVEGLRALPAKEVNDLTSRLVAVRQTLSQTEIAYLQVTTAVGAAPGGLQGIPAIMNDGVVQSFQQAEARARQRVAEIENRYGPMHPRMIAAQSELAEASRNLRAQQASVADAIRNEFESAQAEEAAVVQSLAAARQRYQVVGSVESELNALQREVDANRTLYELFYNRIGEADVTGELESAQARIVSPAVIPSEPTWPNKRRIVVLAFLLALLAGILIAVLLESRDKSVRSYADVEGRLQQTLLGMVPLLKDKRGSFHGNAFFASGEPEFSESIRSIRTAVSLNSREEPCTVIVVTSSLGREGKSTVAMNLAHAFAQNEKTLLLDADLRRSSLGSALNLPGATKGLVEFLEGEAQLADLVIRGEAGKADVMMHGTIPQDPQRLLSGSRMADALRTLKQEYDRIIIDTPPVLPVRDALLLSRLADAVIVVAKADSTPRPQIEQALQLLARVNAPVVGIVVTQLDIRKAEKYSDYGYGGYYGSYGPEPGTLARLDVNGDSNYRR
jgi:polysaccharide biosynthesis transport protein